MKTKRVSKRKDKNISAKDVLSLMMKNAATKSDLKALKEELSQSIVNSTSNVKVEFRKEMHEMESRLTDAMSFNTNKILTAVEKQTGRIIKLEEKVL